MSPLSCPPSGACSMQVPYISKKAHLISIRSKVDADSEHLCVFLLPLPNWMLIRLLGILIQCIEQKTSSSGSPLPRLSASSRLLTTIVLRAHSIRALFYIIAAIPCFLGGICLIFSAIPYAVAATMDCRTNEGLRPGSKSSVGKGTTSEEGERRKERDLQCH